MTVGRQLRGLQCLNRILAEICDNGPGGPIEIDLAEVGSLGGFDGGREGRLEADIALRVAIDFAGAGVDFGGLIEVRRFKNDVPAEGVDRVRFSCGTFDRGGRDLLILNQREGVCLL